MKDEFKIIRQENVKQHDFFIFFKYMIATHPEY